MATNCLALSGSQPRAVGSADRLPSEHHWQSTPIEMPMLTGCRFSVSVRDVLGQSVDFCSLISLYSTKVDSRHFALEVLHLRRYKTICIQVELSNAASDPPLENASMLRLHASSRLKDIYRLLHCYDPNQLLKTRVSSQTNHRITSLPSLASRRPSRPRPGRQPPKSLSRQPQQH